MVFRLALGIAVVVMPHFVAAACTIGGDPALAAQIGDVLSARAAPCAPSRVERRGEAIVVTTDGPDGATIERVVTDVATAATVIESWGADIASPLLAVHMVEPDSVPVIAVSRPAPVRGDPGARGLQLFATVETSYASDRTSWVGPQIGACVMVGPICGAVRLRFAKVVDGPGAWSSELDREGTELLVGGDLPFRIGRATLSPGFGGGIGMIRTHVEDAEVHMSSGTGGLRADVHASLSYPIGHLLALDVGLAIDITQATHVETNTARPFPDEPWGLVRLGAGIRYGGPR